MANAQHQMILLSEVTTMPLAELNAVIMSIHDNPEKVIGVPSLVNAVHSAYSSRSTQIKPEDLRLLLDEPIPKTTDVSYVSMDGSDPLILPSEQFKNDFPELEVDGDALFLYGKLISQKKWICDSLSAMYNHLAHYQRDFIETHDPAKLKSQKLKELGDVLNMHETTISRLTRGRYVDIESIDGRTIEYNLRFLLKDQSGVNRTIAQAEMNRVLAEEFNGGEIISDGKLIKILQEATGITFARRTIHKYRAQGEVPGISERVRAYSEGCLKRPYKIVNKA